MIIHTGETINLQTLSHIHNINLFTTVHNLMYKRKEYKIECADVT